MSEKFEKLRFRVAKTGRAKYISHLDFVRCVQRAIRRSGLPVHYTNGFHPHMEAVFATALPLGMESIGEVLEIRFAEPVEPEAARTCLRAAGTAFRAVACVLAAARSSGGKEVKTWNADGGLAAAD